MKPKPRGNHELLVGQVFKAGVDVESDVGAGLLLP
jgi:hypothetical protein